MAGGQARQGPEQVALDWLEKDARTAQLSWAFRVYYRLRSPIPIPLRALLQRNRRVPVTENWYLPESFLNSLVQRCGESCQRLPIIHPWPHAARFGFVLTHDVETRAGLRNIAKLASMAIRRSPTVLCRALGEAFYRYSQ